ncbi:serine/threonine-protein kinase PLK4-like [Pollicipes pollicipes]|uniref:serine/threonine-protein kinase PLK4-like n=1 Tax=Pollicipes pollicipes TaxID=41117 RepID=UPI0018858D63|nr:serine/threonine-protein kinase PLK4-like [Pollicipes pollicipes]
MAHSCYGESIEAYDVLNPIGKGGFACVYQARCKWSGRDVAIKMIDKQLMKANGMVERVRQEVRIHSRLKHPSILELYTFFEDDEAVYLVLELCVNGELGKHVRNKGALVEDEAREYVRQIVEGMLYLHSNKILHRDLSLSNLLLDDRYHTKIADFGLATQLSSLEERHKTMCGTPNYISPEVATRSWHGMEADVWALGCMLYTMLVGRPPFDTDGVRSTLTKVVMSDVKIPAQISPEATGLITGLLKKNPSERLPLTAVLQHPFMTRNRTTGSKSVRSQHPSYGMGAAALLAKFHYISRLLVGGRQRSGHDPHVVDHHLLSRPGDGVECSCRSGRSGRSGRSAGHRATDVLQGIQPPSAGVAAAADGAPPPTSPLTTRRLKPTRQKTKNAVVTLSEDGEVCLEFVRRRQGREAVADVCRITRDGMRIAVYQPDGGAVPVVSEPPPMPRSGADAFYSYNTLPEKHWKKYIYAARFVKLVKAKTPKLTLYTDRAKCVLMENGPAPDFEVCFYDGCRVVKSSEGVVLHEPGRKPYTLESVGGQQCLSEPGRLLWEHFQQCLHHCEQMEATLERLESGAPLGCFPVVIGRRPAPAERPASPGLDQENRSPNAAAASQMRSFEGSVVSTRTAVSAPAGGKTMRRAHFAGVGTATQLADGRIQLACDDGTGLTIEPRSGAVQLREPDGRLRLYSKYDPLPARLKRAMQQLPHIVQTVVSAVLPSRLLRVGARRG